MQNSKPTDTKPETIAKSFRFTPQLNARLILLAEELGCDEGIALGEAISFACKIRELQRAGYPRVSLHNKTWDFCVEIEWPRKES